MKEELIVYPLTVGIMLSMSVLFIELINGNLFNGIPIAMILGTFSFCIIFFLVLITGFKSSAKRRKDGR